MQAIEEHVDGAVIRVTTEELRLVNNALNEVCNGVDIGDAAFQTRLGVTREEGRRRPGGRKPGP